MTESFLGIGVLFNDTAKCACVLKYVKEMIDDLFGFITNSLYTFVHTHGIKTMRERYPVCFYRIYNT